MSFQVAIDGPAGAGKSTIAKSVAAREGLVYVDTGAMYRAVAYDMLKQGVDLSDTETIARLCQDSTVTIRYEEGQQVVLLRGENVNGFIRTEEVSAAASKVSPVPEVRERLRGLQIDLANSTDCIMDGRDIGTVVLPDAQLKIFLTADSMVRAKRRYEELIARGEEADLETIREDIEKRDEQDRTRAISPLVQAPDAVLVDTSYMTIEEVTDRICELIAERR